MRSSADLSPDGRWLSCTGGNGPWEDIFVIGADGSGLRQLTNDIYLDRIPRWSPDGKRIAFYSDRSGTYQAWTIHSDGSGLQQLTYEARGNISNPVWSPDGSRLAYSIMDVNSFIIELARPWSAQTPRPLPVARGPAYLLVTDWSRDGVTLAGAVHKRAGPPDGVGVYWLGKQQFERLTESGNQPRWLSDNHRLLFEYSGDLYLVDSRSRKFHRVLSVAPYEASLPKPSPDDRWIYFTMHANEADIWQMKFSQASR